jgi:hypothetical protein
MRSVYQDPKYAQIREKLHARLKELRVQYGDSDELSRQFLARYLETRR